MTSNYEAYLDYLASVTDCHAMVKKVEKNLYPLFSDIKRLINYYESTIDGFDNVQKELESFIERLEFHDNDFEYYKKRFVKLQKIREYLEELKSKKLPASTTADVSNFISHIYSSTSLFALDTVEEQVLSYYNILAETERNEQFKKKQKENQRNLLIAFSIITVVLILIVIKCKS